eukprot:TRINITY_DN4136_c0_g3_i2.p1 TRINITY_DN4136_c0_g3~~TRINITY_DN4136_c0_g3_i2.p1  ORF type:complete len:180 (+),score=50.57 TRINITY_DN4136_c0_g3_i2:879-1418(+)
MVDTTTLSEEETNNHYENENEDNESRIGVESPSSSLTRRATQVVLEAQSRQMSNFESELDKDFYNSLHNFGVNQKIIDRYKSDGVLAEDGMSMLDARTDEEKNRMNQESGYFSRCIAAEEAQEQLQKELDDLKKKHDTEVSFLRYKLSKQEKEIKSFQSEKEKYEKTIADLKEQLKQKS